MNPCNDTLRQQIAAGDETAFRQLFEQYSDRVFGVAYTYTKSSEMSEEVVQDIFLKIWTKRESLHTVTRLHDYIFIMTRNHILNLLRGIAREKACMKRHQELSDSFTPAPETAYMQKESQLVLEEAVLRLPPRQRMIYQLNQRHGLKLNEVADQLKLSRNTVRNHLFRAMLFIRDYVRKHDGEIGFFLLCAGTLDFFRCLYI
ncbi:RNA polymerase sigma factor [Chitinophaga lutea]|uniref:RNA polymerase sigma factor n=1 Tax=Chitinophaga lutea TaxID=2488634 RepID=UPI00131537A5|nr:RNA polymerase sigma-70 factor [Chitinophaga lutea]